MERTDQNMMIETIYNFRRRGMEKSSRRTDTGRHARGVVLVSQSHAVGLNQGVSREKLLTHETSDGLHRNFWEEVKPDRSDYVGRKGRRALQVGRAIERRRERKALPALIADSFTESRDAFGSAHGHRR
jgi:hypothetical protein